MFGILHSNMYVYLGCPDLARALRGVRVAEAAFVALEVGEVAGAGGGAAAGQARAHGAA